MALHYVAARNDEERRSSLYAITITVHPDHNCVVRVRVGAMLRLRLILGLGFILSVTMLRGGFEPRRRRPMTLTLTWMK